jgi:hypothetical protein
MDAPEKVTAAELVASSAVAATWTEGPWAVETFGVIASNSDGSMIPMTI